MPLLKVNGEYLFRPITNGADYLALANGKTFLTSVKIYAGPGGVTLSNLWGQYFDINGKPLGPEFRLNPNSTAYVGDVRSIKLADGNIMVTWAAGPGGFAGRDYRANLYDSTGNVLKTDFDLFPDNQANYSIYDITPLTTGGFAVAALYKNGNDADLSYRIFDPNGIPVTAFQSVEDVKNYPGYGAEITALPNGKFLIVWGGNDVKARIFNADGTPAGVAFRVDTSNTSFAGETKAVSLANGGFAITFEKFNAALNSDQLFIRIYGPDGAPVSNDFRISQVPVYGTELIALADGRYLVVYESSPVNSQSFLKARVFNADGTDSVSEFLVAAGERNDLRSVTLQADGNVLITWVKVGFEGEYAQLFDPDRDGTSVSDVFFGTAFNDIYNGLGGDDWISGRAGNDVLNGGDGADNITGGLGADALNGGAGIDFARYDFAAFAVSASLNNATVNNGEAAGDTYVAIEGLVGSAFNDYLYGDGKANFIFGGFGNDWLDGIGGADKLYGGAGSDNLVSRDGGQQFDGGDGFDYARYSYATAAVTVSLVGGAVNKGAAAGDRLTFVEGLVGSNYADYLSGNGYANSIYGGAGRDWINGFAGNDYMIGGAGNDMFRFSGVDIGRDVIRDFADGADRIGLSVSLEKAFSGLVITGNGTTSVTISGLNGATGNQIVVQGATVITLDASDFLFV